MKAKEILSELSTDLLARYKKAAHQDAKKADSKGDYARGDKRFKGINKATTKQFDNDLKKHEQDTDESLKSDNPCWKGYHPVGTKKKGGRTVPNCVPTNEDIETLEQQLADIEEEGKASRALCKSSTPDKDLGASQLASCKSQGLRARDGEKSHLIGHGNSSVRITVGGKRIKGKKYGGPLPDYGTRKGQ